MNPYDADVFLNCPFDSTYLPIQRSIVFCVTACGFRVRCALEAVDSSQNRFDRICELIRRSRFGIHDLSRTEVDSSSQLPRFNMPFELGLFLGAQRFGGREQRRKGCLILDAEQYRYQQCISDLSGQDIVAHGNDARVAVRQVRDWLQCLATTRRLPGSAALWQLYVEFQSELPRLLHELQLTAEELTCVDHAHLVVSWLRDRQSHSEVPSA